ncbi:hypothetical protein M427DRAFT_55763 [Gonapodya prolifera JEL478]|uniref:Uncharacterized protein n=1 Tax=Gonapodya prolifera (strain JEL478) TaxID=1344416 RepID=A0A139AIH1_GONPJ|nr:hypothetical protein M427DRAFT_55763 [Gonapodya prolifera JEL478]|eukprot:KXS16344.1 hypothetical protein M427DRAFT_55763 [Gonapodya prolifera JEL478]
MRLLIENGAKISHAIEVHSGGSRRPRLLKYYPPQMCRPEDCRIRSLRDRAPFVWAAAGGSVVAVELNVENNHHLGKLVLLWSAVLARDTTKSWKLCSGDVRTYVFTPSGYWKALCRSSRI